MTENRYPTTGWTPTPAKRCPTCGATHHDGLYLTCDECRMVVEAVPVLRITIDADTPAELYRGMLGSVHEQNERALDDMLARLSVLDRANPCTEEMREEAGELTRWLATNAPTAFEKWEREHDQRVGDVDTVADAMREARFGESL